MLTTLLVDKAQYGRINGLRCYTSVRPGLVGLISLYTAMNFAASFTYLSTLPAMILARSGGRLPLPRGAQHRG